MQRPSTIHTPFLFQNTSQLLDYSPTVSLLHTMKTMIFTSIVSLLFCAAFAQSIIPRIGTTRYLWRAGAPGVNCPLNIAHGRAGYPPYSSFEGFGIEAAMNFSDITIDGTVCSGDQLKRLLYANPLGLGRSWWPVSIRKEGYAESIPPRHQCITSAHRISVYFLEDSPT